jgi:subtilisin family serine protease
MMNLDPSDLTHAFSRHRLCALLVGLGLCLVLTSAIAAGSGAAPDNASSASGGNPADDRRYIVVLKDWVGHPGIVAQGQAEQREGKINSVYRYALKGYAATLPEDEVDELSRDPRVAFVTIDHKVRIFEEEVELETENNEGVEISEATIPTGISRIFASINKALDIDGKDDIRTDVDVAVIDTGIDYEHPDLDVEGRTICTTGTCVDNSGKDGHSHGTHVAGTIGAIDNGEGVVGIAPGARMWAVKVLSDGGSGFESWIVAGVDWVTARKDIEVANMSLGCACTMSALDTAINKSVEAGVVYAVAAGNSNSDAKNFSPAKNSNVITVSALADYDGKSGGLGSSTCANYGLDDRRASFSNYGTTIEIVAPGACILSTTPGKTYGLKSGTSMAAPHVAGAAAVLASLSNPNSKADTETIREALVKTGNKGWTDTSGDGVQEPLLDLSSETTFALSRWSTQTTPNGTGAEHSALYDMACEPESTSVCTAVGKQTISGTSSPYAQYWNGSAWTNQSAATPEGATAGELQSDHCLSKTSCVSAGSYTTKSGTFSLVESWNGTSWSIQTTPNPAGATETKLNGVSCNVITACIAVGYSNASGKWATAMLGNSGTWSLQTVPKPAGAISSEFRGVECTSSTSCVAVGVYNTSASTYWAMAATWNGTVWSLQTVPKPPAEAKRSVLQDVSCSSGTACTAVGGLFNSSFVQETFVVRWNGTSWTQQTSPNPTGSTNSVLQNVSCSGSSACVAVGDWLSGTWRPMAQDWNGTTWSLEFSPRPYGATFGLLEGVSCRSTTCLGVGWYTDSGGKNKTLGQIRK